MSDEPKPGAVKAPKNCQRGDFAVFVNVGPNKGKVVRCLRWIGKRKGLVGNDRWLIDRELVGVNSKTKKPTGETHNTCQDKWLTPFRGTAKEVLAQLVVLNLEGKLEPLE